MSEVTTNIEAQETTDQNVESTSVDNQQSQEVSGNVEDQSQVTETKVEVNTDDVLASYLESQGLTKDDFENLKKEKHEKSQPPLEEKAFADLVQFGITKKLASKEEILQYENIQKQDDESLVFDKFKKEKLAEDSELEESEIRMMFEDEYSLDSEDQRKLKNAKIVIAQEAKEIRTPLVDKFSKLKTEFVKEANLSDFVSQQETIVNEFNTHTIKREVEVNGEKIQIEVKPNLSIEDVKKHFASTEEGKIQNNILFSAFVEDRTQSEKALGSLLTSMAESGKRSEIDNAIATAVWEKAEAHFKEKSIGAKAPFGKVNKSQQSTTDKEAENQAFRELLIS